MRISVAVLLALTTLSLAAERVVLVEDFTNSACSYCWTFEPTLNAFVDTYLASGDLSMCRVHVNWPSSADPVYLANPAEQNARWSFYNVSGVPTIKVDGIVSGYPGIQSAYDIRKTVPCYLDIYVAKNPGSDSLSGEIGIRLIAEQDLGAAAALRVFSIIVEDNVTGAGYWAGSEFQQAFRDNLFGTIGPVVSFEAPYPDTVFVTAPYTISSSWDPDELYLVTFVQEYAGAPNKEVMNADYVKFFDIETGIGETEGDVEGSVMSVLNPSRGFLSIGLELPSGSCGLLSVYDLGGRIVAERAVEGPSDLSIDLATGIYLVRFTDDGGEVETAQAVVMR